MTARDDIKRQLENCLWNAMDLLRASTHSDDYFTLTLHLIFWKRVSDVAKEEIERNDTIRVNDTSRRHRQFYIPSEAFWDNVFETSVDDYENSVWDAMRAIEEANPELSGLFTDYFRTIKHRLSTHLLYDVMQQLSALDLSAKSISDERFREVLQDFWERLASTTGRKTGEFYTPASVGRLMIQLIRPRPGETIYDPACGSGNLLIEASRSGTDSKHEPTLPQKNELFGQEVNPNIADLARINLFLHGVEDFNIATGDTLREPAFRNGPDLRKFDCVIGNPPMAQSNWAHEKWKEDPYGRNFGGVPPQRNADFAWLQHMIASMDPVTGRMATVAPHGILFRPGREKQLRKHIIDMDVLDAIVSLDANSLYGTSIPVNILIFRSQKPAERQGRVLLIDASNLGTKSRHQSVLEDAHIEQILSWSIANREIAGFVRVVSQDEIARNDWNLNPGLYIQELDEKSALRVLQSALQEAFDDDAISLTVNQAVTTSEGIRRRIDLSFYYPEIGVTVFEVKLFRRLGTTAPIREAMEQTSTYLNAIGKQHIGESEVDKDYWGRVLVYVPDMTRDLWMLSEQNLSASALGRIVFADELEPAQLRERIRNADRVRVSQTLSDTVRIRKKEHDIFVSYRRSDSAWAAGRLCDLLMREFGEAKVFQDTQSIRPGWDFLEVIKRRIETTNILLVIIGQNWLTVSDPESGKRRLDDEDDFVRLEILMAFEEKIEVIPILLDDTKMPFQEHLPEPLQPLSTKHAVHITAENFHQETRRLVEDLKKILEEIEHQS